MPTERFMNLPHEKRARIVSAAINEFSSVPYDEVSINKIIRAADIPRGSFYQYFKDKKDLLEYVMQGFGERMSQVVRESFEYSGGDIFSVFSAVLRELVSIGERYENKRIFQNVFSCSRQADLNQFSFVRFDVNELLKAYGIKVDFSAFRDQSKQGIQAAAEILVTLLHDAVGQVFAYEGEAANVQRGFERKLEMVKQGLLCEGGEA